MFHAVYAAITQVVENAQDHFAARQRQFDLTFLWPTCCEYSGGDLDVAKAAFAVHALTDRAWLRLGRDNVIEFIGKMDWAPFTCPKCKMTSHNPNDAKNRYCGNCHAFFPTVQSGHG